MHPMTAMKGTARAWFDLLRVFNVPIPLAGMLVGAHSATRSLDVPLWGCLIAAAVLGCAATQAFNDFEDRHVDATNAPFRPLPSGRLSARAVLLGGYVLTLGWALLSVAIEPWAALVVLAAHALTRHYSRLKRMTLAHHVLLPAALGLMPVYGSLMAGHTVTPLAMVVGASIFLIDVNMNIVGTFKDLWDGAEREPVLPMVIGARPAVTVALVAGVVGIAVQVAAVLAGLCGRVALLPLALGLWLTMRSRLALRSTPNAEVGYAALKSGRLTECLCFPAALAGLLPFWHAGAILSGLTFFALYAQEMIPEARLPPASDGDA